MFVSEEQKTWAILIAGWSSWPYYAVEATIYKTYQILRSGGILPENIIVFSPDDIAYNSNNPYPGAIFYADESINEHSENVYENIVVDYSRLNNTVSNFLAVLTGNKTAVHSGSGRVLDAEPDDNVLISYVGMGGKSAIYFSSDREPLYADELIPLLENLQADKKFGKMLLMLDAYNSGSLVDGYLVQNGYILAGTSAGRSGGSLTFKKNHLLNTATATPFNYAWMKYLQMVNDGIADEFSDTIFDLYCYIQSVGLKNEFNLYGHLELAKDKLKTYYGTKNESDRHVPKFKEKKNYVKAIGIGKRKIMSIKTETNQERIKMHEADNIYKFQKRRIERFINDICEDSTNGTTITSETEVDEDFVLPLQKFSCYRKLISTFNKECDFRVKENEYVIETQLYKFARLCASNVPEQTVTTAIEANCRRIYRT